MQQQKLRIGLLVDSEMASVHTYELAQWGQIQSHLFISHLVLQRSAKKRANQLARTDSPLQGVLHFLRRRLFGLIIEIERIRSRNSIGSDYFRQYNLRTVIQQSIFVEPLFSDGDVVYRYLDDDIQRVRSLDLDLIIACSSDAVLCGKLSNSARLGIIASAQGSIRTDTGGGLGFWEVYLRQDATDFTIWQLTDEVGGAKALIGGRLPTRHFYLLNQASLYKSSIHYLMKLLEEAALDGRLPRFKECSPDFDMPPELPSLIDQAIYITGQVSAFAKKAVTRFALRKRYRWGVSFARCEWLTLDRRKSRKIQAPPNHFLADPFVIEQNGEHFCFVEDYNYEISRACISVYALKGEKAERLGEAITEPFHLSFPYLFRVEQKLYMCPETSECRDIRVYECIEFPLRWKLRKILMRDLFAVDTVIFEREGLWWLLTSVDPIQVGSCPELLVFYADSPLSEDWKAHKDNPIFIDSMKARNGGLLYQDGSIYRVAQAQGFDVYGKQISINKIEVLTADSYKESGICSVGPDFMPGIRGTHHLHSNGGICVFDYDELAPIGK
jgi:hypothetical protein